MLNGEFQTSNEWHILKGEHQFGPYTYQDMLHMKQNNLLFDYDYIWSPHMEQWTLAGQITEFSQDRISRLLEKSAVPEVFNRRASPRLAVELDLYVHDDSKLWRGKIQNLSQGGALLLIENPLHLPGDVLSLFVKAGSRLKSSFNCTVQVLNKRLVKTKIQHDTALHYAVKFLDLTEVGKLEVHRLFEEFSHSSETKQKIS